MLCLSLQNIQNIQKNTSISKLTAAPCIQDEEMDNKKLTDTARHS